MKPSRPHWWRSLLGLFLIVLLLSGGWAWQRWQQHQQFVDTALVNGDGLRVLQVKPGDSFAYILKRMRQAGIQEGHDYDWRLLAWELGVMRRLQVGEYAVHHGITPRELLLKIERGAVIQHRFTIIPGWSFRELRAALANNEVLRQEAGDLDEAALMARIGAPGLAAEGQFLPETYQFTRGVSDLELLKRAHLALREALTRAWDERAEDLPLESPQQALILASIIEKETGRAEERAEIAAVFIRRLRLGMRLQTDPTVIYGVGAEFNGNLTRAHLETDTPWNTYTRAGLPPTPIALAGVEALHAALHPSDGKALYFVARGDGSHVFSTTLAEHNAAVRRYQLRR